MEHRLMQPASREQIVAIIRQRAERQRGALAAAAAPPGAAANAEEQLDRGQPLRPFPAGVGGAAVAVPPLLPPVPIDPLLEPPAMMMGVMNGGAFPPILRAPHRQAQLPRGGRGAIADADIVRAQAEILRAAFLEGRHGVGNQFIRQASIAKEEEDSHRSRNLSVQGGVLSYQPEPEHPESPGVYIGGRALCAEANYFEVEILEKGASSHLSMSIGVVSRLFPMDTLPGRLVDSYAFCPGDGFLFRGREVGSPFGPRAEVGDKIGCGLKFASLQLQFKNPFSSPTVQLFFTHNGKEMGMIPIQIPPGGLFMALSVNAVGESVMLRNNLRYIPEEDIMMMVDNCEDDWLNLHDIRLNGPMLEYVGPGKSHVDVGLAQAKHPMSTRHHYFEIEIIDPGLRCFIAIGLTRKDYPKNRHPGWNRGSIAYHADDGKVFAGSGVGSPFGPRCHKGDIMGCGVLFPRNYECRSDSDDELEQQGGAAGDPYTVGGELRGNVIAAGPVDYPSDSADDEDWWSDRNYMHNGVKVQIYFTRNGNIIGKREARIPRGGFYPTVGMMSSQEKVRVDLRPLSG